MQTDNEWLDGLSEVHASYLAQGIGTRVTDAFRCLVWDYYRKHERKFPWRETDDPYRILVSEIMLQQTQALRVVPKYLAFLERFPTPQALADAPVAELLGAWQGLGYNRRALSLQRAVRQILLGNREIFPQDSAELEKLPGIGPYTAAAVCAFAFNLPVTVLETNIRRLYIQAFFANEQQVHDKQLRSLIETTLDAESPRDWYYALMDFGHDLARMLPNPNLRSKHYAKQSPFAGSHRQLRGKILKFLIAGRQPILGMAERLEVALPELRQTLKELESEGFIGLEEYEVGLVR